MRKLYFVLFTPGSISTEQAEVIVLSGNQTVNRQQRVAANREGSTDEIIHVHFMKQCVPGRIIEQKETPHIAHAGKIVELGKFPYSLTMYTLLKPTTKNVAITISIVENLFFKNSSPVC